MSCKSCGMKTQKDWTACSPYEKIKRLRAENKMLFERTAIQHDVLDSMLVLLVHELSGETIRELRAKLNKV